MSETTKAVEPREMTEEDFNALMAAQVWLNKFSVAGGTLDYQKMWIAVHSEKVVAAHADKYELYRQLDALGDSIDHYRVLVRYVHSLDELYSQP
jgi:hypothetical protein